MTHPASAMLRSRRNPAHGLAAQDLTVRGMITVGAVAMVAVSALDLVDGRIGILFSLGFALIVVTLAMAVDVRDLFPAGVVPPFLLLGALFVLCVVKSSSIEVDGLAADAGFVTRYIASVIDHGLTLVIGHGLALAVIVWRILRGV